MLLSEFPDVRGGDAFVITVVPFADVLGDLNPGVTAPAFTEGLAVCFPR